MSLIESPRPYFSQNGEELRLPPLTFEEIEKLAANARMGCNESFAHLYTNYYNRICTYVTHITGPRPHFDPQDHGQEVFTRAYSNLSDTPPDNFENWLFKIARNYAIDIIRKKRNQLLKTLDRLDMEDSINDTHPSIENAPLHAAITKLTPKQLTNIIYFYWFDYPSKEIAQIVGATDNAVRLSLLSSREAIKKQLQRIA